MNSRAWNLWLVETYARRDLTTHAAGSMSTPSASATAQKPEFKGMCSGCKEWFYFAEGAALTHHGRPLVNVTALNSADKLADATINAGPEPTAMHEVAADPKAAPERIKRSVERLRVTPIYAIAELPMTSAKLEFKVESVSVAPFRNMIASVLTGNADSFNYWRERLRSSGVADANEYAARAIYAAYAAGVIQQCGAGLQSLSTILDGTTRDNRRLIPGLEERWQKVATTRDSVLAIIQSCLDVIRDFLGSETHARMSFLFEASEPFRTLNALGQDHLLRLNALYRIQQQGFDDIASLFNYIDSALSWMAKENLEVAALTHVAAIIEQLRERHHFVQIFTIIATKLATLIQMAKASLSEELKASIETLASQAASAVPADRIEFADIAHQFNDARLTLPECAQISETGIAISYSERNGLAVSGGISNRLGSLKSEPTGTTSRAIPDSGVQNATDAIAELDEMIGLERVKHSVRELRSLVEIDAERRSAGLIPLCLLFTQCFPGIRGRAKPR